MFERQSPGVSNSTSRTARSEGASSTSSTNVLAFVTTTVASHELHPARPSAKLKMRVFAVLTT